MKDRSKKYGKYYGTLTPYFYDINFRDLCDDDLEEFIDELLKCGVKEILFDSDESDPECSDTLFFETDEKTDFKSLLTVIASKHPGEFSEVTQYCFRMWYD